MGAESTAETIVGYYRGSPGYLTSLQGASHFGFTNTGQPFDWATAQLQMQQTLGLALGLPKHSTVVDAGCGYGRVAATLASPPFELNIIGVDLVPERIEEAQRYVQELGVASRVQLRNCSYMDLPIADGTMDGLYTMETLVHAYCLEDALAEFQRVLRPGGKLVLFEYSVPLRTSVGHIQQRLVDRVIRRTGMTSLERFEHDSFPVLLQANGFVDVTVEDISRNVWPSWRWLFWAAVRRDLWRPWRIARSTNSLAALLTWPNHRRIRYNVITARNPT